ncbi:MAG: iron ABC transporter permease [Dehalococcoidia bacterium]|nr:iron ABC transporter permease [Dehalococcoidia bacterium]
MRASRLLAIGPLAFLGVFFLYPLVAILAKSFGGGALDLGPFQVLLGDSYYLGRIWFTIWQAAFSTFLTLLLGLPVAYLFARHEFPGKTLLKALTTLPFIMPTIVVAMGFVALLGPGGLVNTGLSNLFGAHAPQIRIANTLTIIFMAHAFYNYSIVVRIVSAYWANLSPQFEESSAMLGAGRVQTFRHVTLPLLLPAIWSSAILVYIFSFTSFGVVLVLGGSQFATMEVAIYELTVKLFRLEIAGALAIIQIVFTYVFLFVYTRIQARSAVPVTLVHREAVSQRKKSVRDMIVVVGIIAGLLVILSPLLALVERAISTSDGYSPTHFVALFSNDSGSYFYRSPLQVIWNSIRFALASMVIAMLVGTAAAYIIVRPGRRSSIIDALFMLPLVVSAVTLGFGFLVAFNRPPVDLRGSWLILVIAHSLVAYPFVIRTLLPVLRGMPPHLKESAAVLGASPLRVFIHVELPIIARALIVGATFAFAVSMGEFGASLLLVRPEFATIPVAIFRLLGQPGEANLGQALAMSTLLMAVVALGFVTIERFRYRDVGGF